MSNVRIRKISDFFDVTSSKRVFQSEWKSKGVPFYRAREIVTLAQDGVVENELYISEEMYKDYSSKYGSPQAGDILVTGVGTLGICYQVKENDRFYFKDGNIIWLKKRKEVCSDLIEYAFKSTLIKKQIEARANAAVVGTLTITTAKEILIPLPPLETQQRIAAILDEADALRKKTQQLIDSYEELAQSIFLDMLGDPVKNEKGWEKKKLIEICSKIQIGPFGSQLHQSDYYESGIPLINPTNIKENQIKLDRVVYISEEKFESLPQYHLSTGDIIMARRGDLSKVGLIISNSQKFFCGTGSLFIRCKKSVNMIFIHRLLSDKSTTDHLISEARGITMLNLNKQIISNIPIMLPPLSLQNQFAEKIALINQQKELAKQSLKESEDLFNTLLQKAFRGELELKYN